MNPSYRRDQDHNYMILNAPMPVTGEEFPVRMLVLNRIPGLLPCKMRKMDGEAGFYYEITSLQSAGRIFETCKMRQEDIERLMTGIERAMNGAKEFLLDPDQILLDPEYIYMDIETKEVYLCCLPFYEGNLTEEFRSLAEYMLKKLDHGDPGSVLWGYEIYSRTTEENYSILSILKAVREKACEKRNVQQHKPEENEFWEEEGIEAEKETAEEKAVEKAATKGNVKIREKERIKEKEKENAENLEKGTEKKNKSRQKAKERKHRHEEEEDHQAARMLKKLLVLGIGLVGIAGITWAAAVFGELTEIQAGGIFFLGVGIFYYFTILWKGFPKRKKVPKNPPGYEADRILEEFQEEEEDWEPEQKQYLTGALQMEEKDSQEEFGTTTLLKTSYAGNYAALVSMEPEKRENIVLDRDTLIVGKMPAQADVVLEESVVSRVHAKLERRQDGYFITDQNSTNGTYVNGERLEAYECRKLHTADEIYFASLGYYVLDNSQQ